MSLKFNFRLFLSLVFGFVLCTIIGTVSHEGGHCIIAKILGQEVTLHYASMTHQNEKQLQAIHSSYVKNKDKIIAKESSPEQTAHRAIIKKHKKEDFFVTLGGPIQTMLTGTIGFLILWFNRKEIYRKYNLTFKIWIPIFLSFFWSRQILNFIASIDTLLETERRTYRSDEPIISQYLELPHWAFGLVTCILGILILSWVFFKIIPIRQRLTFLLAGLIGSALGWYIWMDKLGPIILP